MTRSDPPINASWETKSIATTDDGCRLDSVNQDVRPRGRIRRSMTACNTCRKLKTRCDLDPRSHACRRCLSLSDEADYRERLDCELPETPERFQDNSSTWSDANTAIPSIEERLVALERGMGEMMHLMRQMINQSSNAGGSPSSQAMRSQSVDESTANDQGPPPTLQPVQFIQDLQVELCGERDHLSETDLGDVVSSGVIDAKLSLKLMELYVTASAEGEMLTGGSFFEYFSSWVPINHSQIQRSNGLLFNTVCLLASQHFPGMPAKTIHDISLQVQHGLTMTLWRRSPLTGDLLQALALLCLYPSSGHKEGLMDGWLLSGLATNHALMCFGFLKTPVHKSVHPLNEEILPQLRLWNITCLAHLHCALGYGRTVNVQQQHLDHCNRILDHPRATTEDRKIVAEIQLYRTTLRLRNNSHRLRLADDEYEEIERWKMEWAYLLTNDGQSTLEIGIWFCQLLLHRTAARIQQESDRLVPEICNNARLIITRSLRTRFAAAPGLLDHFHYMLGYAALTICDYNPSDALIDQVRVFLLNLAPSSEHIAYRVAYVVGEVQRRYSEIITDHASPGADILKNTLFALSRPSNIDMGPLLPAGTMESLVDGYGCFDQMMPSYVSPHQAFSAPAIFQHAAPITGGAMPMTLVPRMQHDF
ncbi:Transcriptional activator of proteases prtT [Penicillium capsulatum]|uniref:Transcriptional activator of proteases prtT n=1 Tax=Penicillium capsulatum TaxID=69766 RepID=A0A9W9HRT8_9EURO|nr:Transcriptional activator of proteases prtT [Penicillium capsulatum]KAJ6105436.1 Transcriptional activator of proteases prtT [Penicillium capsulatum]